MKISSINNCNYSQRHQSFNGLWSKTISQTPDYSTLYGMSEKHEVSVYPPFYDETQEQIDAAVAQNSSSQLAKGPDNRRLFLIRECRIAAPILIKQNDYNEYMALDSVEDFSEKHRSTHVQVKDLYVNSGFNSDQDILDISQKTAVNEKITNALQQLNTIV